MKNIKCVIFDLDGTLANTYPGIFNSYRYACEKLGIASPTDQVVGEAIGAPLLEVFERRFNLPKDVAVEGTKHYRVYYAEQGLLEATAYEGMGETLCTLKERGYWLGVATLKKEDFAVRILENLGLAKYFDVIVGMNDGDSLTKAQMLEKVVTTLSCDTQQAAMIGDSSYDAIGAKEAGVKFIPVTYGFGFADKEEAGIYDNIGIIDTAKELLDIFE